MTTELLVAALTQLHKTSRWLRSTFYRSYPLRYWGDPLGKGRGRPPGPGLAAQRYNVAGGARVLYLGETVDICLAETQYFGLPSLQFATVPVRVWLNGLLDLTHPETAQALGLAPADLAANFRLLPNPVPTQEIGEACAQHRLFDGILYDSVALPPSQPKGGRCLAVIEGNLRAGAHVEADDPDPGRPPHRLP